MHALYGIPGGRLLGEQPRHNLLYRWCVALKMEDAAWDRVSDTQNRDRLNGHDAVRAPCLSEC